MLILQLFLSLSHVSGSTSYNMMALRREVITFIMKGVKVDIAHKVIKGKVSLVKALGNFTSME